MPKGAEKPTGTLARALARYTNPNNDRLDEEFDAKIRKKQPQWFK
jgi:hypothetical protein